ncbi:hypothetical protein BDF22DRAFT_743246 [Syncephalis plumigaleata]|nr:hypothetical protein BDF22DRAFT_743246 [Syncephalis plumigaleata]
MSDDGDAAWGQGYFVNSTPYRGEELLPEHEVASTPTPLVVLISNNNNNNNNNNSGSYDTSNRTPVNMLQQHEFSMLHDDREGINHSIYDLAHDHQRTMEQNDELENSYRRLRMDNDQLSVTLTKYKHLAEQAERDATTWRVRLETMESNYRTEVEKHKYSKEELRTFKIQLQQAKSQYAFDVRKRDLDMGRLKEKIQKYMTDRNKSNKVGIKLLTILVKHNDQNLVLRIQTTYWMVVIFYKRVLQSMQQREKEFTQENEQLHNALRTLYHEVSSLLVSSSVANAPSSPSMIAQQDTTDLDVLENSMIVTDDNHLKVEGTTTTETPTRGTPGNLPASIFGTSIVDEVRSMVTRLREQWESMTSQALAPIDAEVLATKEQELQEKDQQIQTLREQLGTREIDGSSIITDMIGDQRSVVVADNTIHDITETEMEERYHRLKQQQEELNAEREAFTEAAVKLGLEREQLLRERHMFEEEKRHIETQRMLDILPETPQWLKETPARQAYGLGSRYNTMDTPLHGHKSRGAAHLTYDHASFMGDEDEGATTTTTTAAAIDNMQNDEDEDDIHPRMQLNIAGILEDAERAST